MRTELPQLRDDYDRDAQDELVRAGRSEIAERAKLQHQLLVVAGVVVAAGATVLSDQPEQWLAFGLCLLALSLAFAMHNQEQMILSAAEALSGGQSEHAKAQRDWERVISRRRSSLLFTVHGMAAYAVPVIGAVGFGITFAHQSDYDWLLVVPALLTVLFARCVFVILDGYRTLRTAVEDHAQAESTARRS